MPRSSAWERHTAAANTVNFNGRAILCLVNVVVAVAEELAAEKYSKKLRRLEPDDNVTV